MTAAVLDTETVEAALEAFRGGEWGADCVQYQNSINNDLCVVYDLNWNPVTVRAPELLGYKDKGFMMATPTAELGGTAVADGVGEAAIVSGGETLTITLTDGEWIDGDDFDDARESIHDGLDGSASFDTNVVGAFQVTDVVRTSDTVVTITFPAAGSYSIATDDTVAVTIPANVIKHPNGAGVYGATVAAGSFVVTPA